LAIKKIITIFVYTNKKTMTEKKLNRLKEVLSVPTHSREEDLMVEYLGGVLEDKGYDYTIDGHNNVYVTKGEAEFYPCFIAHTDTVHQINHNLTVVETKDEKNGIILTGMDKVTSQPSGIGGDDKCGVYLCLEMLDKLDNVKAAFFVSEEIGCLGSQHADPNFFKDVGYAIQYDSPEGDSMSMSLMGKDLFGRKSEFGEKVSPLILEHGISKWATHPYTDAWQLLEKFNFSCLNLAAGYYRYHTNNEYVLVNDVENAFELGLKLVGVLGEVRYDRPQETPKQRLWDRFSGPVITERPTERPSDYENYDDDAKDEWQDYINEESDDGFEDLFDYDDFNGGYSINNYGSKDDLGFDW